MNKMKFNNIFYLTGLIFFAIVTFHCQSTEKLNRKNISYIYSNDPTALFPQFKVYHHHPDSSRIYIFLESSRLLFQKLPNDTLYKAFLTFHLANNPKNIQKYDTLVKKLQITLPDINENQMIVTWIDLPCKSGELKEINLLIIDEKRNNPYWHYLLLDKSGNGNEQYFLLKDSMNNFITNNYAPSSLLTKVKIYSFFYDKIYIKYFIDDVPPALPPFIYETPQIKLKKIYTDSIRLTNHEADIIFQNHRGLIGFSNQTTDNNGLFIYSGYETFPKPSQINDMIYPIRYISSMKEFEKIQNAAKPKEEFDNFWLKITGSYARSSELIKKYFTRVEQANLFFTSYTEGWKTDRGIIYVVFGPPSLIYKNNLTERWLYGQENNALSFSFDFKAKPNSPFANDYYLIRDADYKSLWYRIVEGWRTGQLYLP